MDVDLAHIFPDPAAYETAEEYGLLMPYSSGWPVFCWFEEEPAEPAGDA
jgi:hypothetical protein